MAKRSGQQQPQFCDFLVVMDSALTFSQKKKQRSCRVRSCKKLKGTWQLGRFFRGVSTREATQSLLPSFQPPPTRPGKVWKWTFCCECAGIANILQKLSCPIAYSNSLTNLVMQLSTPRSPLEKQPKFAFLVLSSRNTLCIQEGKTRDSDCAKERSFAPFTTASHPHLARKR